MDAIGERVQLEVADLLARNAVAASEAARPGQSRGQHSVEVRTFHAVAVLWRDVEQLVNAGDDARSLLRTIQPSVEKMVLEMISGSLANSLPLGAVFYKALASLLRALMDHGDSRNIMAVANDLVDGLTQKAQLGPQNKAAAMCCLGELFACRHARLLAGHFQEALSHIARLYKASATTSGQNSLRPEEIELRVVAIRCVGKATEGTGKSARSSHTEVVKLLSRAMQDKAVPVRSAVSEAIIALAGASDGFQTINVDLLVQLGLRGLEDRASDARVKHARALGAVLYLSASLPSKPSSSSSKGANDEVALETSHQPVPNGSSKSNEQNEVPFPMSRFQNLRSSNNKLRGFNFLSGRPKKEGPASYDLRTALDLLLAGFERFMEDQVAKADSSLQPDEVLLRRRSFDVRFAFVFSAAEVIRNKLCFMDKTGEIPQVIKAVLHFVVGLCNDRSKLMLPNLSQKRADDFLRRNLAQFFIRHVVISMSSENQKVELASALVSACTATDANTGSPSTPDSSRLRRRQSRMMSSGRSGPARFKRGPLFLVAALSEATTLVSCLGNASLALANELDLSNILPLIEHEDFFVRQETCNFLYACSLTNPGYASNGILPVLQLVGLYTPEVAVALAAGPSVHTSGSFDDDAERTLSAIEGLVQALCVFVHSSTNKGRASEEAARNFLFSEHLLLEPGSCRFHTSLLSGELSELPLNTSVALLGHAKSMAARQHEGVMRPEATARLVSSGWHLIGSLVTLGDDWCRENLPQLFQAWQSCIEASIPSLETILLERDAQRLQNDAKVECVIRCLKAAMQALYAFVRCNRSLLIDTPASAQGVILILEEIVQHVVRHPSTLPHSHLFKGLHSCLMEICCWMPRSFLLENKVSIVQPLHVLAVSYLTNAGAKSSEHIALTSLLRSDGILNPQDQVLETSAPWKPASGVNPILLEPTFGTAHWEYEFLEDAARDLYEELMQSKLLTEDEIVDSSLNAMCSLSENCASTSSIECALVPRSEFCATRAVDTAATLSSVVISELLDDKEFDDVLQALLNILKRRQGELQNAVLHNIVTVLTSHCSFLDRCRNPGTIDTRQTPWLGKLRGIFCVALSSSSHAIRRACAESLAILVKLLGAGFGHSVVHVLKKKIDADPNTHIRSGYCLLHGFLKREASMHDLCFVKNSVVYDLCKLTSQPMRTWALHTWKVIVDAAGMDARKLVKPSIALINAHLLAVEGHPDRGGHTAAVMTAGSMTCLAQLTNSLLTALGPDLVHPESEGVRFVIFWDALRGFSNDSSLQLECVKIIEQILIYHTGLIFDSPSVTTQVRSFLHMHVFSLESGGRTRVRLASLEVLTMLFEMESRNSVSKNDATQQAMIPIMAFEGIVKARMYQPWIPPICSTSGKGGLALRALRREARASSDNSTPRARCYKVLKRLIGQSERKLRPWGSLKHEEDHSEQDCQYLSELTCWTQLFRSVLTGHVDGIFSKEHQQGHPSAVEEGLDREGEEDSEGLRTHSSDTSEIARLCSSLSMCCLESKVMVVEGLVDVLQLCARYAAHVNIEIAQRLSQGMKSVRFVCQNLRELVTGACQAATSTIQGAEVPDLSIMGYFCLVQVLRIFATSKDPHAPERSILKQFEMQLLAALGPGLAPTTSPLILQFAAAFGIELIISGVTSSVSRVVSLLMPLELSSGRASEEDDSDDEISGSGNSIEVMVDRAFDHFPTFVRTEILLMRLVALARLWLFVQGVDLISGMSTFRRYNIKRKALQKPVEKAFAPFFFPSTANGDRSVTTLAEAWIFVVKDFCSMLTPAIPGKRRSPASFQLIEPEDSVVVFPAFRSAAWQIGRAVSLLAKLESLDLPRELLGMCIANCTFSALPDLFVATSFESLAQSSNHRVMMDADFVANILFELMSRPRIGERDADAVVVQAAFDWLRVLSKSRSFFASKKAQVKTLEAVLLPIHKSFRAEFWKNGKSFVADFSTSDGERRRNTLSSLMAASCEIGLQVAGDAEDLRGVVALLGFRAYFASASIEDPMYLVLRRNLDSFMEISAATLLGLLQTSRNTETCVEFLFASEKTPKSELKEAFTCCKNTLAQNPRASVDVLLGVRKVFLAEDVLEERKLLVLMEIGPDALALLDSSSPSPNCVRGQSALTLACACAFREDLVDLVVRKLLITNGNGGDKDLEDGALVHMAKNCPQSLKQTIGELDHENVAFLQARIRAKMEIT